MTDLWTDIIPTDTHRAAVEAAFDAAMSALAPKFAFVSEATTKASFTDRMDIVRRDIGRAVEAATINTPTLFATVHEGVLTTFEADFDAVLAARQDEQQRRNNKRGWWRRKAREGSKTAQQVAEQLDKTASDSLQVGDRVRTKDGREGTIIRESLASVDAWLVAFDDGTQQPYVADSLTKITGNVSFSSKTAAAPYPPEFDDDILEGPFGDGVTAYLAGKPRIPPQAPEGNEVGGPWADQAREWLRGWDAANMSDESWMLTEANAGTGDDDWMLTTGKVATQSSGMRKGAPFAGYTDWDDCVAKNKGKVDDVDRYCGYIKHKVEDNKEGVRTTAAALSAADIVRANIELSRFTARGEFDRLGDELETNAIVSGTYRVGERRAAVTIVRAGALYHWAVTDDSGDDEKDSGSTKTIRDTLEEAWDALNKVLDHEPPPPKEMVEQVEQAADATGEAVEDAGGKAPDDPDATGGTKGDEPDSADKPGEDKPTPPERESQGDDSESKGDTDATDNGDEPPPSKDTPPNDGPAEIKDDAQKVPEELEDKADGDPAPDKVVDAAEDLSDGDVQAHDPKNMDAGQRTNMTYTLEDGTTGDADVTFLREQDGIYFFDGPQGEFGIAERDGKWVDSEGNSFAFSQGDAVEEVGASDAAKADIDLDAPVSSDSSDAKKKADSETDKKDGDGKGDEDDDGKGKGKPPWLKAKESMLAENPQMSVAQAERLAKRAATLAETMR